MKKICKFSIEIDEAELENEPKKESQKSLADELNALKS